MHRQSQNVPNNDRAKEMQSYGYWCNLQLPICSILNVTHNSFLEGALPSGHTRCCFLGPKESTKKNFKPNSGHQNTVSGNSSRVQKKELDSKNASNINIISSLKNLAQQNRENTAQPHLSNLSSRGSKPGLRPVRCMACSRQAAFSRRRCW